MVRDGNTYWGDRMKPWRWVAIILLLVAGVLPVRAAPDAPPAPGQEGRVPKAPCYHTIDGLYAEAEALAQAYPEIASLHAIGSSVEGRPLLVLEIGRRGESVARPFLFVVANAHGREFITPEVAWAFARALVQGYGTDADATWMVDSQRTFILLSLNPDGHVANESGPPWPYWRKNRNPAYGCATTYGVDLNRNFSVGWNAPGGTSTYACSNFYRGPQPFSEPETAALRDYFQALVTSSSVLTSTAGASLYISLHAHGNGVMWPWAYTGKAAPDAAALSVLGYRLARDMGYWGGQAANSLYLMSGADMDWVYGTYGLPAYTFEIGAVGYTFFPACSLHESIIASAVKGLWLAARIARAPYALARGPEVSGARLEHQDGQVVLRARLDDRLSGSQRVTAGRVYVDTPPWAGGAPLLMTPSDGRWDKPVEEAELWLRVEVEPGRHILYVQGRDERGHWGPVRALWWEVASPREGME